VPCRPYLQFFTQAERIWGEMPHRERLVLIAVLKHSTTRSVLLRVMDLINLSEIGSPATIHGAIKRLEVGHYLKLGAIKGDQRIRAVSLTSKSLALFKRLDRLVLNSITSK
jgi:DNA-binding MarR family transcriptional regulator